MKKLIVLFVLLTIYNSYSQMTVRDADDNMLMVVRSDSIVGIGNFESTTPNARLEVKGTGTPLSIEWFDNSSESFLASIKAKIPNINSTMFGHVGMLAQVEPTISVQHVRSMTNSGLLGQVYTRSDHSLAANGQVGNYQVFLGTIPPGIPTHLYRVSGIKGVIDADNIVADIPTTTDGFATALMANVMDNIDPAYDNMYALYTQGAKSYLEGNVGIGTTTPDYTLDVDGDIYASGTIYYGVGIQQKPDFVFHEQYNVLDIRKVESFIQKNDHLPWITPAKDEKPNAIDMGRLNLEMLETIENLQLQIIKLNKRIEKLEGK